IAADAKEINFFAALIDDEHHRGDFQHNAEWDFLIKRNMFSPELLLRIGELLFYPQDLLHGGDHRDHDFKVSVGRGAKDRPKLGREQRRILFIYAYGTVAEEGIVLS